MPERADIPPVSGRWGRMASVRANYDVPAYRGREVVWLGGRFPVAAKIISSTGSHLYVRDATGRRIGPLHPCWRIDYQDGRGDRTGQPTPMDQVWAMPENGSYVPSTTPSGVVITATLPNGDTLNVTAGVQTLYDNVIASMDWGSGFLTVEDAEPIVEIAKACGFEGYEEAERYVNARRAVS